MIDSVAVGDNVTVHAKVVKIIGNLVVVDIDGECLTVSPSLLWRPVGGKFTLGEVRRKGREARLNGKSISDCPYAPTKKGEKYRQAWIEGWTEGG